jgi:hypothetical protein
VLDEANEDYYFAPARALSMGKHTFSTRAVTDFGAVSSVVYYEVNVTRHGTSGDKPFNPENCLNQPITRPG